MKRPSSTDHTKIKLVPYVLLHGSHAVPKKFYDQIYAQVDLLFFLLEPGQICTAQELCAECYWVTLNPRQQRLAGSCISHLAEQSLLPIVKVSPPGTHPAKYKVIGQLD